LENAQKARQFTANVTLAEVFLTVQDTPALFDEVERIVHVVADAQPRYAFQVGQVIVQISDTNRRRIVHLTQAP
jgi:hypothetical protein